MNFFSVESIIPTVKQELTYGSIFEAVPFQPSISWTSLVGKLRFSMGFPRKISSLVGRGDPKIICPCNTISVLPPQSGVLNKKCQINILFCNKSLELSMPYSQICNTLELAGTKNMSNHIRSMHTLNQLPRLLNERLEKALFYRVSRIKIWIFFPFRTDNASSTGTSCF